MQKLAVDAAVAQFSKALEAELGSGADSRCSAGKAVSPEEAETRRFRQAEALLRLVCPDPTRCAEPRCRRGGLCQHFADLRARQEGRRSQPATRRTPGAAALRHAIWIYMNSDRES